MGSSYVLTDITKAMDVLDCPGRVAREVFDIVDSTDMDCPEIAIFAWEYYGFSDAMPEPFEFTAAAIENDMKALIGAFYTLVPDRKIGALTILEWIDRFERVLLHARDNPESLYRSRYFE